MQNSALFGRICSLFLLFAASAGPAAAQTDVQSPSFSNVDDALLGRRLMLPVQDLAVAFSGTSVFNRSDLNLILKTADSKIPVGLDAPSYKPGGSPLALASGRMFDLPNDVLVTLSRDASNATAAILNIYDPFTDKTLNLTLDGDVCKPSESCPPNLVVMGDLTGDGYAEVVIGYSGGGIQVASAKNPGDFGSGIDVGPLFGINPALHAQAIEVLDVESDGPGDIAVVAIPDFKIYRLASPTETASSNLEIELASSIPFNPSTSSNPTFALRAGQFDNEESDREMVLAYNGASEVEMSLIKVDPKFAVTILDPQNQGLPGPTFSLGVGRLNWFGSQDQIALVLEDPGTAELTFKVLSVSGDAFVEETSTKFGNVTCQRPVPVFAEGIALGDYDFDLKDPAKSTPDLEIAVLMGCGGPSFREINYEIHIFATDPGNNFALTSKSVTLIFDGAKDPGSSISLVASDTQGRSILLGPPQKITINNHLQPRIVMGAPPMHIDYVQDPIDPGKPPSTFGKINMTAFPSTDNDTDRGMNSSFDVASNSTTQNQSAHTTSYGFSTTTGIGGNISFGVPDIGGISASARTTATTTHDQLFENKFGTYSDFDFEIDTITGFGDVVWFDAVRFNVWTYRILGHLSCPASDAQCDSKLPLNLTLSGPDEIVSHPHTPGEAIEWYQPYHEAGNILSYPPDKQRLESALQSTVGFHSFFNESFITGGNADTETLNWASGDNSAKSTGYVKTHKQEKSESLSANAVLSGLDFASAGGGGGISYRENRSKSISTLNTTVETMASTTGFTVSVPGFNLGSDYSYPFEGFILGDASDPDVVQTALLEDLKGKVDLTVNGTLRLAFTAQPDQATGAWWANETRAYLSAPDVALHHPKRWSLLSESSGPLSSVYCFNILDRDSVESDAYEIKGFFVLPEGAVSGPQLSIADADDTLDLQARVYNYSRMDMDQAATDLKVKVDFYGQEWDTEKQQFSGDAFRIGQVTLDPIKGNNSQNTGLNSALATANFDISNCPLEGGCGGKYLKFWVVVWMEDGTGSLVADYQGHGLAKKPASSLTGLGQVDVQAFSNNVGFYDQELYVCPTETPCNSIPQIQENSGLAIDSLVLASDTLDALESTDVDAWLHGGEQDSGPITVIFYDGNPEDDGQVFEVEHVPLVKAESDYLVRVRFRPTQAGFRELHVIAHAAGARLAGQASAFVEDPVPASMKMCQSPSLSPASVRGRVRARTASGRPATFRLSALVQTDQPIDLNADKVIIDRFIHESGGGGELLGDSEGESIGPLILQRSRSTGPMRVRYETPPGTHPRVRLTLKSLADDVLKIGLRIGGATVVESPNCSGAPATTFLMTRIASADDSAARSLDIPLEVEWQCVRDRKGRLREFRARNISR